MERVLTVLRTDKADPVPTVLQRRLPLVTLGRGRTTLRDKLHAHVHQTWLEYGPRGDTVLRANAAVRQCLSDMGTEFGLADARDITHECMRVRDVAPAGTWLYPAALQVPGTQHILDTILKDGLDSVTWWHAWEQAAKVVCQWVHPRPRREWLQSRLCHVDATVGESLRTVCDRFAVWRWKTLWNVTRDLLRMKEALITATSGLRASDLASRDGVLSQTFLTSVQSHVFWMQSEALHALAEPVAEFSSWLRACPCHEHECLQHAHVDCAWKGCRGPELSGRVRAFAASLLLLRDTHAWGHEADTHAGLTRMLAVAHVKFAWVDDLPFFIWQVRSRRAAAEFLAKAATTEEASQHRVTLRFAAGELRQDMDAWLAGTPLSPRLRLELESYQWCKLDDTWAEATHRDVSRLAKRVTFASQAWQSASLRLQQNLDLWAAIDGRARARFHAFFYRWKAIGHLNPRLALRLTRRKLSTAAVLHFVYRTGAHALEDWSTQLRHALDSGTADDIVPQLSFASQLKVDFLRRVLLPSHVFTLPAVTDADALVALDGHLLATADAALHAVAAGVHFPQVVEESVRRRKCARTATARKWRGMWFLVMLQRFTEVARTDTPMDMCTLRPQGAPVLCDLLDFATWRVWRGGLRVWKHVPALAGAEPGTLCVGAPELISLVAWDMSADKKTLALVVLDKLVHDGWHVGCPPVAHTVATPRTFSKPVKNQPAPLLALSGHVGHPYCERCATCSFWQAAAVLLRHPGDHKRRRHCHDACHHAWQKARTLPTCGFQQRHGRRTHRPCL